MNDVVLTDQQFDVLLSVEREIKHRRYVRVGGYAGTGKSALLKALHQRHPTWPICVPSWQAANVLRMRGMDAVTVHRFLYSGSPVIQDGPERSRLRLTMKPEFRFNGIEAVLVDEANMVASRQRQDLESLGIPIIYIGDPGQLPPVGETYNSMRYLDFELTQNFRSSSGIVEFSNWIRAGKPAGEFDASEYTDIVLCDREQAAAVITQVDQVACSFNKTRLSINKYVRKQLGFTERLEVGDRIIALTNSRNFDVFNGMSGKVVDLDFKSGWISMDTGYFGVKSFEADFSSLDEERPKDRFSSGIVAIAHGYARTAYSMQGSECGSLLVIEEDTDGVWSSTQGNYTLATRAQNKLYWKLLGK